MSNRMNEQHDDQIGNRKEYSIDIIEMEIMPDLSVPFGDKRMFHYFREESVRNIAKQYGWDLITPLFHLSRQVQRNDFLLTGS